MARAITAIPLGEEKVHHLQSWLVSSWREWLSRRPFIISEPLIEKEVLHRGL